jgi:flagellar protein FliS
MGYHAHDAYLENRVLSADPTELVRLLYQAGLEAVRDARRHLANGDIVARSRAISKASAVLLELVGSLDLERGGEIAERLGRLYDYMLRRLTEANFQQSDAPLAEVLSLMATLAEAWNGIRPESKPASKPENPWAQPVAGEAAGRPAEHAWSF